MPTRTPRLVLATFVGLPDLCEDDRLAVPHFEARGWTVEPVCWDDGSFDWSSADAIVLRSTWDYVHRIDRFRQWIRQLRTFGTTVFNHPALLERFLSKEYLRDLERAGVRVVPTRWVEPGADPPLEEILREQGWSEAVLKPALSAAAYRTTRVSLANVDAGQRALSAILAESTAMVQPFLGEELTQGEWSLIFLGGRYSHAVLKRPAPGDFRVQEEHGGSTESAPADPCFVAEAERLLDLLEEPCLYARVDAFRTADGLLLSELEVVEPLLFLSHDPRAPVRFAEALGAP